MQPIDDGSLPGIGKDSCAFLIAPVATVAPKIEHARLWTSFGCALPQAGLPISGLLFPSLVTSRGVP